MYPFGSLWLRGLTRKTHALVSLPCHCSPTVYRRTPGREHVATIYKRLTEDGRVRYTAYIRLKGHPGNPRPSTGKRTPSGEPSSTKPPSRPGDTWSARRHRNGPWQTSLTATPSTSFRPSG